MTALAELIRRPDLSTLDPNSYEFFTQQPFYRTVDAALISRAPRVKHVVDLATGTGAMIEHLIEQDKLQDGFRVIGVDIDPTSLATARTKFADFGNAIIFVHGDAHHIPIPDESVQLVTFGNAIHLTHPEETLSEAARILVPGGLLLTNSAYVIGVAYPGVASRFFPYWTKVGRDDVQAQGFNPQSPLNLMRNTMDEYVDMAKQAGFIEVETDTYVAAVDQEALKAIGKYREYAEGALPGVPYQKAAEALVNAVEPAFARLKIEGSVPRGWMFLVAKKP